MSDTAPRRDVSNLRLRIWRNDVIPTLACYLNHAFVFQLKPRTFGQYGMQELARLILGALVVVLRRMREDIEPLQRKIFLDARRHNVASKKSSISWLAAALNSRD